MECVSMFCFISLAKIRYSEELSHNCEETEKCFFQRFHLKVILLNGSKSNFYRHTSFFFFSTVLVAKHVLDFGLWSCDAKTSMTWSRRIGSSLKWQRIWYVFSCLFIKTRLSKQVLILHAFSSCSKVWPALRNRDAMFHHMSSPTAPSAASSRILPAASKWICACNLTRSDPGKDASKQKKNIRIII